MTTAARIRAAGLLLLIAVAVVGVRVWLLAQPDGSADPSPRPNIVLISLDTVRPDHLSSYGYGRNTSPNLDRLAGRGVRFTRVWATAPWTLPSHMSVFTSLPPSVHTVDTINRVLGDDVPSVVERLREHGYHTAALVNNGQMRAHWGFSRGFDVWREFDVDTPDGDCDAITREALRWLGEAPTEPWLLFLHYYDAHDPYGAPEPWREKFGATLTGPEARRIAWRARLPDQPLADPTQREQLIAAYDAEIAWMDHEIGKLIDNIGDQTMVIVFTDHGEAFEEHGWTLHGATVYEEETRAGLIIRYPDAKHAGTIDDAPTSLIDIAPTLLSVVGLDVPDHYMGEDLWPRDGQGRPSSRPIIVQTKAVLEGRIVHGVIEHPWKLIYNLFDQTFELYRLPDEQNDVSARHPDIVQRLRPHMEDSLSREAFRLVHVRGPGRVEVTVETAEPGQRIGLFIPVDADPQRDAMEITEDARTLRWVVYPDDGVKTLYIETDPYDAAPRIRVSVNDAPESVVRFDHAMPTADLTEPRDLPAGAGVSVQSFQGIYAGERAAIDRPLDADTERQLRSLGYTR